MLALASKAKVKFKHLQHIDVSFCMTWSDDPVNYDAFLGDRQANVSLGRPQLKPQNGTNLIGLLCSR